MISLDGFPASALQDPLTPVPSLRQLAAAGALATGKTVANPAVTWPNHTTMVTGVPAAKHGVLYNGMLVRGGASWQALPPRLRNTAYEKRPRGLPRGPKPKA